MKRLKPIGSDIRSAFKQWSQLIDRTNQELKNDLLTVVGTVHHLRTYLLCHHLQSLVARNNLRHISTAFLQTTRSSAAHPAETEHVEHLESARSYSQVPVQAATPLLAPASPSFEERAHKLRLQSLQIDALA